jgi:hypothetical protein
MTQDETSSGTEAVEDGLLVAFDAEGEGVQVGLVVGVDGGEPVVPAVAVQPGEDLAELGDVARARVQVRAVFPGPGEVSLFLNRSDQPARLLCVCTPPGQEQFFAAVGTPVASRPELPPALDEYD